MLADYEQQEFRDIKIRQLIKWLEDSTGFQFVETSSRRIGDDGVHGTDPTRASDLRCRSLEVGIAIETWINKFWEYDSERPWKKCCFLHGEGADLHLHLQVHKNTKFIGG